MRTDDGLLVVGADEGLAGPGDIVIKLQASQTGGRWGVAVVSGVPGEGGRTHIHRGEPEGFFVLQGEVELLGVSSQTPIGPGTFVLVPPDTEHGLRIVGTDEARWLAIWPAALDGFVEELLTLDPDDAAGAADVRRRHGTEPGRTGATVPETLRVARSLCTERPLRRTSPSRAPDREGRCVHGCHGPSRCAQGQGHHRGIVLPSPSRNERRARLGVRDARWRADRLCVGARG